MAIPVVMPQPGNSVEVCLLLSWKRQVGDTVKAGEVLAEIETDKAVMDLESPADGVVLALLVAEGQEVPVKTVVAQLGQPGEQPAQPERRVTVPLATSPMAASPSTSLAPAPRPARRPPASPRARQLALQRGIALEEVAGSGPGGRILAEDVARHAASPAPAVAAVALPAGQPTGQPLSGVRKRTAQRMLASLQQTAQLTLTAHAPAQGLLDWRQQFKAQSDPRLVSITLNDLVMFAVARTLPQFPQLNALLVDDVIYPYQRVHLGFALDTPRGLLVPVLQDAHQLGLGQLAQQAHQLAERGLAGQLSAEALGGATFTVSNLGALGIESFTPVLNPPQVGILGVGCIHLRPVQQGTEVKFLPHLTLSLTIDHRAIDGAPAARFLQALSSQFDNLLGLLVLPPERGV
jgi:pyruvate dehydrogenase E2 component (dihydrolipoamide acetyltransferase)